MELKTTAENGRVESIDFVRGLVMIVMALDHVRVYLHYDTFLFSPTDLSHTTPAIFFTRFVTHLCAPTFILLSGVSAYFVAARKSTQEATNFLLTRGAWLVLLQITLIQFGWTFDPALHYISSNIISTIGFCMIWLALLVRLRMSTILFISATLILGHNLLDGISFETSAFWDVIWSFLHVRKKFFWGDARVFHVVYPIVPWIAVMSLGYCMGELYSIRFSSERRKKILIGSGLAGLAAFVALRAANFYGDPIAWTSQNNLPTTVLSFFNVEKYPPSLLYLLVTLGTATLLLGLLEGRKLWRPVTILGKVALFYYVVHIFVIHVVAIISVEAFGYPWHTMIFEQGHNVASPLLKGKFGFGLALLYVLWTTIVIALYPLCEFWYRFKTSHKKKWWVSYL